MKTIICTYCKKEVEISQALLEQISEDEKKLREEAIEKARLEEKQMAERRLREELELKEKNYFSQQREDKERIGKLIEQLEKAADETRELRQKDEERELENKRKLLILEEKIKEEMTKKISEEKNFEMLQLKKQLEDTQKSLEEAKRKSQQVSQQLQGEVLELELEEMLRSAFPEDEIKPVGKGISGADIEHIVRSTRGTYCGTILWELKQTKHWDDKWIGKLKDDMRTNGAHLAAIVSAELPKDVTTDIGHKDGVWICSLSLVLPLAMLLRKNLYDVAYQKHLHTNSTEKAELVYAYLTGHEFQQQIESTIETYLGMKEQLEKEKLVFQKQWKVRDEQISKVLLNTANFIGSIQGKVGTSMPAIKGLELLELSDGEA